MPKKDWPSTIMWAIVFGLMLGIVAVGLNLFVTGARAEEPAFSPYVSVGLGAGYWDCLSNDCDLEADSDPAIIGTLAGGVIAFENFRFEIEGGYRNETLHGLNRDNGRIQDSLDGNSMDVFTVLGKAYYEYPISEDFSLYAGGGAGVVVLSALDWARAIPALSGGGGVVYGLPVDGLSLDLGVEYLWAVPFTESGTEVTYDNVSGVLRLRYSF